MKPCHYSTPEMIAMLRNISNGKPIREGMKKPPKWGSDPTLSAVKSRGWVTADETLTAAGVAHLAKQ